jgi:hypothetical protein
MLLVPNLLPVEDVLGRELHKNTAAVHIQVGLFQVLALFPFQRLLVLKEGGVLKDRLPNAVFDDLSHANDSFYHLAETLDRYFSASIKKPHSLANLISHLSRSPFDEDKGGEVRIIFVRLSLLPLLARLLSSIPLRLLFLCRLHLVSYDLFSSCLRLSFR